MAQNYTRQSSFDDGDTITASLFNNEFNQVVNALAYSASSDSSTGHKHDGTSGQGGNIPKIGDIDFLNKVVVDSTNNRWGFFVQVSSSSVEQIRIQDGAIVPVTDSDIDLGTSSLEFKDLFLDGTAHIDTLDVDANATIAGTLGVTGNTTVGGTLAITGNTTVGGTLVVTGTTTFNGGTLTLGDAASDNVVFGADVNSNIIPNTDSAFDLGSSGQEWRDLYLDGTAHIDTLDVDVNATVAGTLGVTGVLTGTSLDISGDIDVDGTTNLDVVDIDGAVDMATTLTVAGNVDFNGDLDVDGTIEFDAISGTGSVTVTNILDEDDMSSNSATALATQQSIKAYVDAQQDTVDTFGEVLALGNTTSGTNVELTTTDKVQFRDAAIYINSSADGQLDIVADTEIQIAATTIDINGAINASGEIIAASLDISGNIDVDGTTNLDVVDIDGAVDMASTLAVAGVLTGASLDISGDIDVDGTTNLDVVDIDGAVDMASTLQVDGAATFTTKITANGGIALADNDKATFGTGNDLEIYHDSSNSYITDVGTGNLKIGGANVEITTAGGTKYFQGAANVAKLFHTGNERLATSSSGITVGGTVTATGTSVFASLDISGDIDVDGTTNLDVVDIDGAVQLDATLTIGANDQGYDVILYGDTASANVTWDTSADDLIFNGGAGLIVPDGQLTLASTAITSTAAELNALDGITAVVGELNALDLGSTAVGTAIASKAVILDSNKDYTGVRNFSITGNLSVGGTTTVVDTVTMNAQNAVLFEGATADSHETTLTIVDPTADRTINLPNQSGTLPLLAAASNTAITSTPEELNILDGVTSTAAELNALDGITAVVGELNSLDIGSTAVGTAVASKAVILDSNKDYTGIRNLTISGELDGGSLDISGDADIDGTTNLDVVDIDGAVDMASTLAVGGATTLTAAVAINANIENPLTINSSLNGIVYNEVFNINTGANAATYFGIVTQNLANSGTIRSGMFFDSLNHLSLINGEAGGAGIVLDDNNAVTMSGTLGVTGAVAIGGDVTIENGTPILAITYTDAGGRIDFNNSSDAVKARIFYLEGTGLRIGSKGTDEAITIPDGTDNVNVSGGLRASGDQSTPLTNEGLYGGHATRGAHIQGHGSANDVTLSNQSGTVALAVPQATINVEARGDLAVTGAFREGAFSDTGDTNGVNLLVGQSLTSRNTTGSAAHSTFHNPNGVVGSISTNGSATSFNTSSDPRLKSEFATITGASAMILEARDQGLIGEFAFLSEPTQTVWGYNAHKVTDLQVGFGGSEGEGPRELELGAVYEEAVMGERPVMVPELDAEGNPTDEMIESGEMESYEVSPEKTVKPAGIDQSKRVPLLEAAIGELLDRIAVIEASNEALLDRITALENA